MPYNAAYFENHYAIYAPNLSEYDYAFNVGEFIKTGDDQRIDYNAQSGKLTIGGKYIFKVDRLFAIREGVLYKIQEKM